MGWSKYKEDIENRNAEAKDLKKTYYNWGKKNLDILEKMKESKSVKSEFEHILNKISNIKLWIKYDKSLLNIFTSKMIIHQLEMQVAHLNDLLDEYFDKFYDSKFNVLRNEEKKVNENRNSSFEKELNQDFFNYLITYASKLKNKNQADSFEVRKFDRDLSLFIKMNFDVEMDESNTPSIKYLKEVLTNKKEIRLKKCNRCKKQTYEEFSICIYCNNDLEEN